MSTATQQRSYLPITARSTLLLVAVAVCLCSGCAALTNPVANGIPVRLVPDDLLAESKEDFETIPWGLLQRVRIEKPVLRVGDVLGVYVEGALGAEDQLPPVSFPEDPTLPPALGFPIPIRVDGTVPVPLIDPPRVVGLTIEEAEQAIIEAYEKQEILTGDGADRVIVTLARPRTNKVIVIRQDSPGTGRSPFTPTNRGIFGSQLTTAGTLRLGAGFSIDLAPNQSDVLTALARTGGLPGLDSKDEILVYRNVAKGIPNLENLSVDQLRGLTQPERIPLKVRKGQSLGFNSNDVILNDDDILVVEVRDPELYYTAGLLRNQEVPLPADYDLTVLEAIARVGGPLANGGFGGANLTGSIVSAGLGDPSPTQLTVIRKFGNNQRVAIRVDLAEAMRDPRENILVKTEDMLVLQETTGEAFVRYAKNALRFDGIGRVFTRGDASGGASFSLP